jgi:ABC-2 type transport system permease protein
MVFQVICQDLRLASLGNVLLGLAMLAAAVFGGGIEWTLGRALTLTAMVLCGAVLFFGVFLIYATLCFFTMEGLEVLNIFTDGVKEHGRYPFDVYGKGVLWFLTALLPFALVQYWPLLYLTGNGPAWYGLLPLASLWFLLPCFALWRFGLRHYRSAGS